MKTGSTLILKATIYLIGAGVLAICTFVLPVGLRDGVGGYTPIIIGMYIAAIPFYIALYQALKLLSYIDQSNAFSELSVTALKNIKYCAIAISSMFAAGMPYIFIVADRDDAPGVVAMALVIVFASVVIAVFATLLQKLLQNGMELKSENDLTV